MVEGIRILISFLRYLSVNANRGAGSGRCDLEEKIRASNSKPYGKGFQLNSIKTIIIGFFRLLPFEFFSSGPNVYGCSV